MKLIIPKSANLSAYSISVNTIAEASLLYAERRDQSGEGLKTFPFGTLQLLSGKQYRVSYNARIWDGPKLIYCPSEYTKLKTEVFEVLDIATKENDFDFNGHSLEMMARDVAFEGLCLEEDRAPMALIKAAVAEYTRLNNITITG